MGSACKPSDVALYIEAQPLHLSACHQIFPRSWSAGRPSPPASSNRREAGVRRRHKQNLINVLFAVAGDVCCLIVSELKMGI